MFGLLFLIFYNTIIYSNLSLGDNLYEIGVGIILFKILGFYTTSGSISTLSISGSKPS